MTKPAEKKKLEEIIGHDFLILPYGVALRIYLIGSLQ